MKIHKIKSGLIAGAVLFMHSASFCQVNQSDSTQETTVSSGKATGYHRLEGIASYYHPKFEGRVMSNGEKHSKVRLTAACNKIPLGRWVRVTNLRNNQSVEVRITDRMNKKNTRLIDLSLAAAQKLGMIKRGTVRVEVVEIKNRKHKQGQ